MVLPCAINSLLMFWISKLFHRHPLACFQNVKPYLLLLQHDESSELAAAHHSDIEADRRRPRRHLEMDKVSVSRTVSDGAATSAAARSGAAADAAVAAASPVLATASFEASSRSCFLNAEQHDHEENIKLTPDHNFSICLRRTTETSSTQCVGDKGNEDNLLRNNGAARFLSPTNGDYSFSPCRRHRSADCRSEHSEFLGTSNASGPKIVSCRSVSVVSNVSAAATYMNDASVINLRLRSPCDNADFSLIIPGHYDGIPNWVLQVRWFSYSCSAYPELSENGSCSTKCLIVHLVV